MELLYILAGFSVLLILLNAKLHKQSEQSDTDNSKSGREFFYSRKESVMTPAEMAFYNRLEQVVAGRYYIFPQIHLSALLVNQTKGRDWKAAFQRINRTSVDYVLCDKQTMKPVYAVELDDSTHDTAKRHARDAGVDKMLADASLPLLRFRNASNLTDNQISQKFEEAASSKS